jgi:hypothetical protein
MKHEGLAVLLGAPHDDDEDEHEGDDGEISPEEHAKAKDDAVKEMMASVRTGKSEDFRKALEAFIDLHEAEEEDAEEEDEEDSEADKEESYEGDLEL